VTAHGDITAGCPHGRRHHALLPRERRKNRIEGTGLKKMIVEGGRPLEGEIHTAGAKNAVLPMMAGALLGRGRVHLRGAPKLRDVRFMTSLLRDLGAPTEQAANGDLEIDASGDLSSRAPYDTVRRMRASICVLGPLLARQGRVEVSQPGGCVFGLRPIDVHIRGLRALGADISLENGNIQAKVPPGGLTGARMYLGSAFGSTVLGTANVLMAATLAKGMTQIQGAACEPEIVALADQLNAMGARITGQGSPIIEIEGVDELGGAEVDVIPDRIEAGTYALMGAMTGGRVRVTGCRPDHLLILLDMMRSAGLPFEVGPDWIETQARDPREATVRSTDVSTNVYPGFPTDLQAQWMALMTQADGISLISERIYPERWTHIPELMRLGADIRRQNNAAVVRGVDRLSGAPVMASDLRASAALVMAGLVADGRTEVRRMYHLERGYEAMEQRLEAIGAGVMMVEEDE
jgi:UDP-N-acetylglucosamine 1-carboxyvinyltransferase